MKRRRIILHIGQFKSGTTSIQEHLVAHRASLKAAGVHYPALFMAPESSQHALLNFALRREYRQGQAVDATPLLEEIDASGCRTIILSCEGFGTATLDEFREEETLHVWRRLRDIFCDFDIQVAFGFRRQDDAIESRIIQAIKGEVASQGHSFRTYLGNCQDLDYFHFSERLDEVFGSQAVVPMAFSSVHPQGLDMRETFFRSLGLPAETLVPGMKYANVSPTGPMLEFLRIANGFDLEPGQRKALTRVVRKHFNGPRFPKAVVLDYSQRLEIMGHFAETNGRFARKYSLPEDRLAALTMPPRTDHPNLAIETAELVALIIRYMQPKPRWRQ